LSYGDGVEFHRLAARQEASPLEDKNIREREIFVKGRRPKNLTIGLQINKILNILRGWVDKCE